jgi:hypothetical protein
MKINFHNKNLWKLISLGLLTTMFFTFNQCVVQQYDAPVVKSNDGVVDSYHDGPVTGGGTLPPGGSGEFQETGATEVARLITDVGVKDFEAIYVTFQVLTGVDPLQENVIRNSFSELKTQLPFDASIKSFNTAHQIATIKLASEFCHRLFESSAYYNIFFTNFNIGQSPNNVLNANGKIIMINDFINRFWGENVQPIAVEQVAIQQMSQLIDALLVDENMGSSTTTRKVAKGVCTSLLASAPVTTL